MPSTGVGFEDPPDRTRYDWTAIAEKAKRRPGKWYLVFKKDRQSLSVAIRQSGIAALLPENGFEVRTANNVRPEVGLRTCSMWVRYVPEKDRRKK